MNITLKNLKEAGFEVKNNGTKGEYDCFHNGTDIQLCRDKDGSFWTDLCGKIVDLKKMSEVDKIIELARNWA